MITAKVDKSQPDRQRCDALGLHRLRQLQRRSQRYRAPRWYHGTIQLTNRSVSSSRRSKSGAKEGEVYLGNSAPTVAEMANVYGRGNVSF